MGNKENFDGLVRASVKIPLIRQRMTVSDGFENEQDANAYGDNACGAACMKMVMEAFDVSDTPSVKEIMDEGLKIGVYRDPVGWIHSKMADFMSQYGLQCSRKNVSDKPSEIPDLIQENKLIIASVSLGFDPEKKGGHLIVLHGVDFDKGKMSKIFFNDPSGWGQTHSSIDVDSFLKSWTGNIIIAAKKSSK